MKIYRVIDTDRSYRRRKRQQEIQAKQLAQINLGKRLERGDNTNKEQAGEMRGGGLSHA